MKAELTRQLMHFVLCFTCEMCNFVITETNRRANSVDENRKDLENEEFDASLDCLSWLEYARREMNRLTICGLQTMAIHFFEQLHVCH